jgi:ParB-like chromosome segregation protein Spo0J
MGTIHVARDLKLVPIETLIPYEKNARTHSDEQVSQIAASIKEFGWTQPILVDGEKGIIAGHGRLAAAKLLNLPEVPVIELAHLSKSQKRALILADNKLALNAGWDETLLAEELRELSDVEFDLDVVGFSDEELNKLLGAEAAEAGMPALASGEKTSLAQMTFTVSEDQKADIERALSKAKGMGDFVDTGNENSNGNALARVAEFFLGRI